MPLLLGNASAPRRIAKTPIAVTIDLTVTPPYSGAQPGQINSGEMVYRTSNYAAASLATAGSANANAASFIGVALDVYPPILAAGIYLTVPPGDTDPGATMIQLYEDGDHLFNATAGDTYQAYMPVYLGADGRTIQLTPSGTSVGYVSPDQRPLAALPLGARGLVLGTAAVAGQSIYIRIKPALAS